MEYIRKCLMCDTDIKYANISMINRAEREKRCCRSCGYKKTRGPRKIYILERICPKCNKILKYKSYFSWWQSNHRNLVCRSCTKKGKTMPVGFSENLSEVMKGDGNPMYGRHHTNKVKQFISLNNKGNKSKLGQTCSDDIKMNMRNAAIKRIQIQGTSRSYNPISCKYMDTLIPKFNFTHAENSGDEYKFRGYFADGYDVEKNIWFEYDESHHFNKDGTLRNKDLLRMEEIIKYLNCRFIRYNEKTNILCEYILENDILKENIVDA